MPLALDSLCRKGFFALPVVSRLIMSFSEGVDKGKKSVERENFSGGGAAIPGVLAALKAFGPVVCLSALPCLRPVSFLFGLVLPL